MTTTASAAPVPAKTSAFVPPRLREGDLTSFPLTFLDGTRVVVTLPADLAAQVTSFVPAARACVDEACTRARTLEIVAGSADALYAGREPVAVYRDAAGEPVPSYADGDRHHLVFEFGDWVVRAWDPPGHPEGLTDAERARFAASLRGHVTDDGFLQLSTSRGRLTAADAPVGVLRGEGVSLAVSLRLCSQDDGASTNSGPNAEDPDSGARVCAIEQGVELGVDPPLPLGDLGRVDVQTLHVGPLLAPTWARVTFNCATSTGPLHADGIVVGTDTAGGEVRGYDASGRVRWRAAIGPAAFVGAIMDGLVVAMPQYGAVAGLDLRTGAQRWRVDLDPAESAEPPAAHPATATMVFGTTFPMTGDVRAPHVHAVDLATGETRWTTELVAGLDLQWSAPVIVGDLALLVDTPKHADSAPTSYLHALDVHTGALVWRADLEDGTPGFHCNQPQVAGQRVTVRTNDGGERSFDLATGQPG